MIVSPLLYCPPIDFFMHIKGHRSLYFEQHETYSKGTYRNKMEIAGPNGRQTLSIPVQKISGNKPGIQDVQIAFHENWPTQHLRSIKTAYGNAPFYDFYIDQLETLYSDPSHSLFEFNLNMMNLICSWLKIDVEVLFTTSYVKDYDLPTVDLRPFFGERQYKAIEHQNPRYPQVFEDRLGWCNNLSILDLIMCQGPAAMHYLG